MTEEEKIKDCIECYLGDSPPDIRKTAFDLLKYHIKRRPSSTPSLPVFRYMIQRYESLK